MNWSRSGSDREHDEPAADRPDGTPTADAGDAAEVAPEASGDGADTGRSAQVLGELRSQVPPAASPSSLTPDPAVRSQESPPALRSEHPEAADPANAPDVSEAEKTDGVPAATPPMVTEPPPATAPQPPTGPGADLTVRSDVTNGSAGGVGDPPAPADGSGPARRDEPVSTDGDVPAERPTAAPIADDGYFATPPTVPAASAGDQDPSSRPAPAAGDPGPGTTSPAPEDAVPSAAGTAGEERHDDVDGPGHHGGNGATTATPDPFAELDAERHHATVICVANQKGGVGKTTTTVSLGAALAMEGAQVLVVDLDPQGNATTGLGLRAQEGAPSTYRVIVEQMDVEDASEPTAVRGLHVLPSSLDLAGAEIELVPAFSREMRLKNALDAVRDLYDVILIDCPPSLGLLTINAFVAADQVLVPIQCEYYALEGLGQLMRTVKLVGDSLNRRLEVGGVVLTMFDGRTNLSQQVVDEVRGYFGDIAYQTIVPRTVRLSEAPSYGQPIGVFDASSRGARAYQRLAREVARRLGLELDSQDVSPLDRLLGSLGTPGPVATGMNEADDAGLPTDLHVEDLRDLDADRERPQPDAARDDDPATPHHPDHADRPDGGSDQPDGSNDHAPAWSETAGRTAGTEDDR